MHAQRARHRVVLPAIIGRQRNLVLFGGAQAPQVRDQRLNVKRAWTAFDLPQQNLVPRVDFRLCVEVSVGEMIRIDAERNSDLLPREHVEHSAEQDTEHRLPGARPARYADEYASLLGTRQILSCQGQRQQQRRDLPLGDFDPHSIARTVQLLELVQRPHDAVDIA